MRKRVGARLGVTAGLLLATIAHLVYWYWPREHAGLPGAHAAAELDERGWDAVLWIPYPHQNLGLLERQVGDVRAWFALLAGAGPGTGERIPGFGPFVVPPAREMLVATAENSARIRIELEVYPGVRWMARAAGALARNPWLTGGTVHWRDGAEARVDWEEGRWRLSTGEAPASDREEGIPPAGRSLAQLRLGHAVRQLPDGRYRLVRGPAGLALLLGDPPPAATAAVDAAPGAPAGWMLETEGRRSVLARAAWTEEGALDDLPTLVVLGRGPATRRLRVPGEEILRLAGRSPETLREAGFEVRGLSRAEVERGAEIARRLDALLANQPDLRAAMAIDPRAVADISRRLGARFKDLPLLALAGIDPGRIADLLAPWERCGTSRLEVWRRPVGVRWELCPVPSPASN